MRRISAKNDKRKTAKATTPLRFKENIFLLYRDLISTFEVQSPHMLTRIFLAGYPPILGMVYVSRSCCLQTIKIPPNFKSEVGECLRHSKTAHRNIVFFIRWACPIYIHIKNRADEPVICSLVHRLCVLCVWLFNDCNMTLFYSYQTFLLALWTKEWKVFKLCIFPYHNAGFVFTNWT